MIFVYLWPLFQFFRILNNFFEIPVPGTDKFINYIKILRLNYSYLLFLFDLF